MSLRGSYIPKCNVQCTAISFQPFPDRCKETHQCCRLRAPGQLAEIASVWLQGTGKLVDDWRWFHKHTHNAGQFGSQKCCTWPSLKYLASIRLFWVLHTPVRVKLLDVRSVVRGALHRHCALFPNLAVRYRGRLSSCRRDLRLRWLGWRGSIWVNIGRLAAVTPEYTSVQIFVYLGLKLTWTGAIPWGWA